MNTTQRQKTTRTEVRQALSKTRLLTLAQASDETGVPYTSIRDLILTGYLPAVRLGDSRRIWIRRKDLDALIERSVEVAS